MTDQAQRPADRTEGEGGDAPRRSERARAAAYLDLWERNLCHLAVHGPRPDLSSGGR